MRSSTVRIIGNAPSAPEGITSDFKGVYIGLNSAPQAFLLKGIHCDICWVQDWRFFIQKRDHLTAASAEISKTTLYTLDNIDIFGTKFKERIVIPRLGRFGFSYDPQVGVFEGYTAAYGALQLAQMFSPGTIELYGVDFSYGLTQARFYQAQAGWDLDLHVHGKQIQNVRYAIRELANVGIGVSIKTPSLVTRLVDGESLEPARTGHASM